jgi:hypothetical protein
VAELKKQVFPKLTRPGIHALVFEVGVKVRSVTGVSIICDGFLVNGIASMTANLDLASCSDGLTL